MEKKAKTNFPKKENNYIKRNVNPFRMDDKYYSTKRLGIFDFNNDNQNIKNKHCSDRKLIKINFQEGKRRSIIETTKLKTINENITKLKSSIINVNSIQITNINKKNIYKWKEILYNHNRAFSITQLNENKNYNDDENDFVDIRGKNESIYYMKNPFAEKKDIRKDQVRRINKNYIKLPGLDTMNEDNLRRFMNGGIYGISHFKELVESIEAELNTNIFYIYGKYDFKIRDDICKYFYMEKKYINGIYLVKTINSKEELQSFLSKYITNNDSKLVVFGEISNQGEIFVDPTDGTEGIIQTINKINNTKFVIFSKVQEIKNKEIKFYEFKSKNNDENLIELNKEYRLIQSIINNINIKN